MGAAPLRGGTSFLATLPSRVRFPGMARVQTANRDIPNSLWEVRVCSNVRVVSRKRPGHLPQPRTIRTPSPPSLSTLQIPLDQTRRTQKTRGIPSPSPISAQPLRPPWVDVHLFLLLPKMISLVLTTFKSLAFAAVSRRVRKPTPATDPAAVAASPPPPPPPPHVLLEVATETDVEGEPVGGVTQPGSLLKGLSGKLRVRWPFMRWVCTIVLWQLLLTAAVVVVCLSLQSVLFEHLSSHPGAIRIAHSVLFVISVTMMALLWILRHRTTINVLLVALCTVSVTAFVGAESPKVMILIVSTMLSPTLVVVLTAYTLWAATPARRLYDSLLVCLLACGSLLFLNFYFLAQRALIPCGKAASIFHGCAFTLIFSGLLVADMDNLVAGQNQEEYVMMAMNIYLDVISLFVGLLSFGGSEDGCM